MVSTTCLRKTDVIIATEITKDRKKPHKNSIDAPVTPDNANKIYRKNGNNFWRKAIEIETHAVGKYLDIFHEKYKFSYVSSKATGHILFNFNI